MEIPDAPEGLCPHWNKNNYQDNFNGRMIYKEECGRCFATPKDADGLYVCLQTFVGNCKTHALQHYKNTGNPLALNIKKIPKKLDEEATKVTKLAIGMAGGIDPEQDKYDTELFVYCYACEKQLDHTLPEVASMVDSLLMATSAAHAAGLAEWEDLAKPCEHTLTLQQEAGATKLAAKALAHCNECDLKANLWLCLVCGNLGCGRKQPDGSGGN